MHKYMITFLNKEQELIENADLSWNFPGVAVFKIKGEVRLTIPYSSILKIERID